MWVIKDKSGNQGWTIHEDIAITSRMRGDEVTEVVPAADLAAERDLVQRLADALNCFDYDGHGKFLATFGLRKVEGRWVKVNG